MGYTEDTVEERIPGEYQGSRTMFWNKDVLVEVYQPTENWNINLFLLDFLETGEINEYSSWNLQEKFSNGHSCGNSL